MNVLTDLRVQWVTIPLGEARGGSGATQVDLLHVTVADDRGAEGTGFTYVLTGGAEAVHALLGTTVRRAVLGCPLDHWPRAWQSVWEQTARMGHGASLLALSAVDIAVWDLRARATDLPLYRFLGAHRDTVPVYGSGRATHQMTVEELVEGATSYVADGYDAVKLRVGARRPEEDVERVRAVREAVGERTRLMVDCNERLDLPTALWMAPRMGDLGVFWMEEPLHAGDVAGHATLAARSGVPIAVGEHLHGRFDFGTYLRAGAASILQPDVPLTGGVTEWLRISAAAETFGAVLSPHFLPELHVHMAAAVPNCTYIEHFPLIDDVLLETLPVHDGLATPPDRPGHGISWDDAALDRFRTR
ncbi:mandelate racemase/muconate lactonizing enzyme family protein [Pseudonocardia sichuanensis]